MCGGISDGDPRGASAAITATSNAATTPAATTSSKIINEPAETRHNPPFPFPASSLRHDTYDGVTLDLTTIDPTKQENPSVDAETFSDMLDKALDIWTLEKRRGIWLKIPTSRSHLNT